MTTAHSSSLEEHEEDSGSGSSDGAWAGGGDDNDEPSCSAPCSPPTVTVQSWRVQAHAPSGWPDHGLGHSAGCCGACIAKASHLRGGAVRSSSDSGRPAAAAALDEWRRRRGAMAHTLRCPLPVEPAEPARADHRRRMAQNPPTPHHQHPPALGVAPKATTTPIL
jgi:hypothetical protein